MKSFFTIILLLLTTLTANAQRNAIWVFGDHGSWDFRSGSPQPFDSTQISVVGSNEVYGSSICDPSGNLLFYTDGFTVWNKKHQEIPKLQYRWPWSEKVVPLICPYPGNDSLFYIFGVSNGPYANRLQAVTINTKANREKGAIVYPVYPVDSTNYYEVLMEQASVFVAGTHYCNKSDIWIVGHSGNQLKSFLVTKEGISKTPVISNFSQSQLPAIRFSKGNMKFSPSGERMLLPMIDLNKVLVFDFNNETGFFSNPFSIELPAGQFLTDAEFSPDGNRIYLSQYYEEGEGGRQYHTIAQVNLNLSSVEEIRDSYLVLNAGFPDQSNWCTRSMCYGLIRTLALAPDGKIYFSMLAVSGSKPPRDRKAGVIQYPNELGINALLEKNAVEVGRQYKQINYNYIRSYSYTPKKNGIQYKKNICSDKPVEFSLLYKKVDAIEWDFGDPQSGSDNFSQSATPHHIYPAPGKYNVKAIFTTSCVSDTAYAEVIIDAEKSVKVPLRITDTIICTGSQYIADATTPYATNYLWGGGNIDPKQKIIVDGTYNIRVQNSCSIDEKSFTVKFEKCSCSVFVPTGFTPNNDGLNDIFKPFVSCYAVDYSFKVFDRYGTLVLNSNDYNFGWNGKRGSYDAAAGSYIWQLEYTNPNDKKQTKMHGTVVLIR